METADHQAEIKLKRKGLLITEGFPYIFTLIVGFIAFQYNEVTGDIKDSPIIQYELNQGAVQPGKASDTTAYTCTIENVSSKTRFKLLRFIFIFPKASAWNRQFNDGAQIEVIHPAAPDTSYPKLNPDKTALIFNVNNFQPETSYNFNFRTIQPTKKPVEPYMYINSEETLILKDRSWLTWCASHRLLLNGIILGLLFIVLFIYFIYLNRIRYEGQTG